MTRRESDQKIIYTVQLTLESPIDNDPDGVDYPTSQQATHLSSRTAIEKNILHWLRKLEQECTNVEVTDWEIQGDEPNPREKGDDDGIEYADPRDYRDGRE